MAFILTRSITPLKTSSDPMGSCSREALEILYSTAWKYYRILKTTTDPIGSCGQGVWDAFGQWTLNNRLTWLKTATYDLALKALVLAHELHATLLLHKADLLALHTLGCIHC